MKTLYSLFAGLLLSSFITASALQAATPVCTPIPLSGTANRTFADPVANDKQGGWTDQGPGNDMSVFKATSVQNNEITFSIIDEANTGENSCIVIAGSIRDMAPAEITLPLPDGIKARGIALLHATGWVETNEIGRLIIHYADSGIEEIPVVGGKDVGNWWVTSDFENGKIAWSSRNSNCQVGLFASAFELGGNEPVSITFRITNPEAIWMIAGVTLTAEPVVLPKEINTPFEAQPDDDWHLINYKRTTTPGSPLDFSFMIPHKPAGSLGFAKIMPDGHLAFESAPDTPIRLLGVNVGDELNCPPKKDAELIAKFLASLGINAIRFHRQDGPYIINPNAKNSLTVIESARDNMEYFMAKLEEQGIYLTTDLYISRQLRSGDNLELFKIIPELTDSFDHTISKNAIIFCDDAFENWKEYARDFLLHVNPYTGKCLAQDPALVFVSMSNEDTVTNDWNHTIGSVSQRLIAYKYKEYCDAHPDANPEYGKQNPDFMRFINEQAQKRYRQMREFLHNELGARFPITGSNNGGDVASTWMRDVYDVIDDHIYSDHPMFPVVPWGYPMVTRQNSIIDGHAWTPLISFRGRIYGKPFYITEVDFGYPNMHRNEEGPVMGAYCSLQDIDGYFFFGFSGSYWRAICNPIQICVFESCCDVIKQLSYRINSALYLRRDVAPATEKVSYTIPRDLFKKNRDYGYPWMSVSGLIAQIGTQFDDRPYPGATDHNAPHSPELTALNRTYNETNCATSLTGEIHLKANEKILHVDTERSATVTLPKGASVNESALIVKNSSLFQTFAAISRTEAPLYSSDDIIILHSTDVLNRGDKFTGIDRRRIEVAGHDALLLHHGTATLSLPVDGPRTVTAVDFQGDALGPIEATFQDGMLTFEADNFAYPGGIAGYHVTADQP